MSYQVLARKYRPQRFSEVIGQEHVTRTLRNAIEQQRIAHGYIFSGHRGIGKTTVARILAMGLNCRSFAQATADPCGECDSCREVRAGSSVDVIEIDAATNRGIDEIRELREAARYRPARDRYKIYILDEAHQITDAAFNALLKTLEEPPEHVVFMLATTQPEDIPHTIRSRCQHFSFHSVGFEEMVRQLRSIAQREGTEAGDDALAVLAEAGEGSIRDALSIMDQAIAGCGGRLTAELVRGLVGTVSGQLLEQIMVAVGDGSSQELLRLVDGLLTAGQNPAHLAKQVVGFLRNLLVAKVAGAESPLLQISSDERARVARVAEGFQEEELARFLQIMLRTYDEIGYRQEQRFHLELGLLKMAHAQRLLPLEDLLNQAAGTPAGTSISGAGSAAPGGRAARSSEPSPPPPQPFKTGPAGREADPGAPRGPSPFEVDRARKQRAADAAGEPASGGRQVRNPGTAEQEMPPAELVSQVRAAVVEAFEQKEQRMLAAMLESADWRLEGDRLCIRVAAPQTMVEMSLTAEPRRIMDAAAAAAAGRTLELHIVAEPTTNGDHSEQESTPATARGRAGEHPVVRRMQEKFGAEIRTVIDHREKP